MENVIFWRGTDSEKIFLQQFGRGLRGNKRVRYFDYVGGLRNFSGIYNIYSQYRYYKTQNDGTQRESNSEEVFLDPDQKFILHNDHQYFNSWNVDL